MPRPNTTEILPLDEYDYVIVSFSGGKDSTACYLHMLDLGVPDAKIQLWHQDVDNGVPLMDWPCTPEYCAAFGETFGVKTFFQGRSGGFKAEMLREDRRTNPVRFQRQDGTTSTVGGTTGKRSTRRKFPQVSADLKVRWCSAYLKIDVAARALNNDPAFRNAKILFVTGERRQESAARSKYAEMEKHRCNSQSRRVDHWRVIIDWPEERVWELLHRYRVDPHPAYKLGWGRVSCMSCIFGDSDQWASLRELSPAWFRRIATYEIEFGCTIRQAVDVTQLADRGKSFLPRDSRELREIALGVIPYRPRRTYVGARIWRLPLGAFKTCGGPT